MSLADARQRREDARRLLASGVDPGITKRISRRVGGAGDTFEVVAREWHGKFCETWVPRHAENKLGRLELNVFPWLGVRPVGEITAVEVLEVLRRMEERGVLDTAHRVRVEISQVMRYAIATGRAERDPTLDLRGALPPNRVTHRAAPTDPWEVAALLRAIDAFQGSFVVMCALRLAPLLFVRPGELRAMEWIELDLESGEPLWSIPGNRMKMGLPHVVPLPRQAVEILRELQPLTRHSRYVFPGGRTPLRPMSDAAVNAALRRMGFESTEITGHGFRAMARTILDEVLQVRPDYIEHQLAHAVRDPNGRAYNRTAHLDERRKMMQLWADYLDGLKNDTSTTTPKQPHTARRPRHQPGTDPSAPGHRRSGGGFPRLPLHPATPDLPSRR